MIYKNKLYNWVNQKKVGDDIYDCYRCDTNPKKCIITKNGEVIKETEELKVEWEKI